MSNTNQKTGCGTWIIIILVLSLIIGAIQECTNWAQKTFHTKQTLDLPHYCSFKRTGSDPVIYFQTFDTNNEACLNFFWESGTTAPMYVTIKKGNELYDNGGSFCGYISVNRDGSFRIKGWKEANGKYVGVDGARMKLRSPSGKKKDDTINDDSESGILDDIYFEGRGKSSSYYLTVNSGRTELDCWEIIEDGDERFLSNTLYSISSDNELETKRGYSDRSGKLVFRGKDKAVLKYSSEKIKLKKVPESDFKNKLRIPVSENQEWITGVFQVSNTYGATQYFGGEIALFPNGTYKDKSGTDGLFQLRGNKLFIWEGKGYYESFDCNPERKQFSNYSTSSHKAGSQVYYSAGGATFYKVLNDTSSGDVSEEDCYLEMDYVENDLCLNMPSYFLLKLYSKMDIMWIDKVSLPEFNGFRVLGQIADSTKRVYNETIGDVVYNVVTLQAYMASPLQKDASIGPAEVKARVQDGMSFNAKKAIPVVVSMPSMTVHPQILENQQEVRLELTAFNGKSIDVNYVVDNDKFSECKESFGKFNKVYSSVNVSSGYDSNDNSYSSRRTWRYSLRTDDTGLQIVPAIIVGDGEVCLRSGEIVVRMGNNGDRPVYYMVSSLNEDSSPKDILAELYPSSTREAPPDIDESRIMTDRFDLYSVECDHDVIWQTQDVGYTYVDNPAPTFEKYPGIENAYLVEWTRSENEPRIRLVLVFLKDTDGLWKIDNAIENPGLSGGTMLFDYSKAPVPVYDEESYSDDIIKRVEALRKKLGK